MTTALARVPYAHWASLREAAMHEPAAPLDGDTLFPTDWDSWDEEVFADFARLRKDDKRRLLNSMGVHDVRVVGLSNMPSFVEPLDLDGPRLAD